jgi:hypothetical protein
VVANRLLSDLFFGAGLARSMFKLPGRKLTREDGLGTFHNSGFQADPNFQRCYARAVKATGWDYGIRYRVHQALWCAAVAQGVQGDFVELGTGRGFIMSAVLESGVRRPVHLFDTFAAQSMDVAGRQNGKVSQLYADSFERVSANFAEWPNAMLHRGDIRDTLDKVDFESVAFLHVDVNHPDPEEYGIRSLWPKMPKGAVMLLDDYAYSGFERQFDLGNRLAEEFGYSILTTPSGQGIVVKT